MSDEDSLANPPLEGDVTEEAEIENPPLDADPDAESGFDEESGAIENPDPEVLAEDADEPLENPPL